MKGTVLIGSVSWMFCPCPWLWSLVRSFIRLFRFVLFFAFRFSIHFMYWYDFFTVFTFIPLETKERSDWVHDLVASLFPSPIPWLEGRAQIRDQRVSLHARSVFRTRPKLVGRAEKYVSYLQLSHAWCFLGRVSYSVLSWGQHAPLLLLALAPLLIFRTTSHISTSIERLIMLLFPESNSKTL